MTTPHPVLSGKMLSLAGANELKKSVMTDIIVVAGGVNAGKTTLLSSLYDQFMEGPVGNLKFAGTLTLRGFEEVGYTAKTTSRQSSPIVDHTDIGADEIFLHLKLVNTEAQIGFKHLLMTDWSGEISRRVSTSVEFARTLDVIRSCARFALLIDGDRIANPDERQKERTLALLVLRSCLDATILGDESNCDIVFTKWDLIQSGPPGTIKLIEQIKSDIAGDFADRLGTLTFHETAARVQTVGTGESAVDRLADGYGLKELLHCWVGNS